jgi:hypothetical protein
MGVLWTLGTSTERSMGGGWVWLSVALLTFNFGRKGGLG